MKKYFLIFSFTLLITLYSNWRIVKTENFKVFYKKGYDAQAMDLLNSMEYFRLKAELITGNKTRNLPVIIEDIGCMASGFADPIFYRFNVFTYHPQEIGFSFFQNWLTSVSFHEYIHILHFRKTGMIPYILSLMGGIFLTNLYTPGFVWEGITVYGESQLSGYSGRLNDGEYDAYMRALISEERFPDIKRATFSIFEYPYYGNIYLFGGKFFSYLAERYGQDAFTKFFEYQGSSFMAYTSVVFPFLSLDYNAFRAFGASFPKLWREWTEYEYANHIEHRSDAVRLTHDGNKKKDLIFYENKLYYISQRVKKTGAFNYISYDRIMSYDIFSEKSKALIEDPYIDRMQISNGHIYYTVYELKEGGANFSNSGFKYIKKLYRYDITKKKKKKILTDEIRSYHVDDKGNVLYSKDKKEFGSELIFYEEGKKRSLFESEYLINEIVEYDGGYFFSAKRNNENFGIYRFDHELGIMELINSSYSENTLGVYDDKLFFTSNYEKQYNIYFYIPDENIIFRSFDADHASYPAYDATHDIIYYIGINSRGNDVYMTGSEVEKMEFDGIVHRMDIPDMDIQIKKGGFFDNLVGLLPAIRIPFIYGNVGSDGYDIIGIYLLGRSVLGDIQYDIMTYYDLENRSLSFDLGLSFAPSFPFSFNYGYYQKKSFFSIDHEFRRMKLSIYTGFFSNIDIHDPYIFFYYSSPKYYFLLGTEIPLILNYTTFDPEKYAVIARFNNFIYLAGGRLLFSNSFYYDPWDHFDLRIGLRGFENNTIAKRSLRSSLDYSIPVLKIRKGLWNPNIYLEDLCVAVFADYIYDQDHLYSYGLELVQEFHALFFLRFSLGLRFAVNNENMKSFGLIFQTNLPVLYMDPVKQQIFDKKSRIFQ